MSDYKYLLIIMPSGTSKNVTADLPKLSDELNHSLSDRFHSYGIMYIQSLLNVCSKNYLLEKEFEVRESSELISLQAQSLSTTLFKKKSIPAYVILDTDQDLLRKALQIDGMKIIDLTEAKIR